MHFIENFLEALTNADVDGRVVVNRQGKNDDDEEDDDSTGV